MNEHLQQCGLVNIGCENQGCQEYVARQNHMNHSSMCMFQKIICDRCDNVFERRRLRCHDKSCPKMVIACNNDGCTEKILRETLAEHLTSCVYSVTNCTRCKTSFIKQHQDTHDCTVALYIKQQQSEAQMNGIFSFLVQTALPGIPPIDWTSSTVSISSVGLDDRQMGTIVQFLNFRNTMMERLLFSNVKLNSTAISLLSNLARWRELKDLRLSGCELGNDGARALAVALRQHHNLRCINISYNSIGEDGARELATALEQHRSLQEVRLSRNPIGINGTQALATALRQHHDLQALDLSYCFIGVDGAQALATTMTQLHNLRYLGLSGNSIGIEGARAMGAALQQHRQLQRLRLSGNAIEAEGAGVLATALLQHEGNLQELYLSGNAIGVEGARAIATALQQQHNLQQLDLSYNFIDVEGAQALAMAIRQHDNLQKVDLIGNFISAEGARAIASALLANQNLQQLHVSNDLHDGVELQTLAAAAQTRNLQPLVIPFSAEVDVVLQEHLSIPHPAVDDATRALALALQDQNDSDVSYVCEYISNLPPFSINNHSRPNALVVTAMRGFQQSANVQQYACRALANLSVNAKNKASIAGAGGIDVIVNTMRGFQQSEDVQQHACRTCIMKIYYIQVEIYVVLQ
eukprot:GILJ01010281.1.p1 GENE.GILJ01010281.1~~GILJ01010281.1.p1  ORF type:complete len:705 (+),score=90.35 GILJ01010281.1:203-2116(+)